MENNKQPQKKLLWTKIRSLMKKEGGKIVFQPKEKLFYHIFDKKIEKDLIYYQLPSLNNEIIIKYPQNSLSLDEVQDLNKNAVDSTGIKLWPAEEIMAYYVSQNLDLLKNKRVLELGAGYSGLASLVLALYMLKQGHNINITITDGLDICVERILENVTLNNVLQKNFNVSFDDETKSKASEKDLGTIDVKKIVWSKDIKAEKKYDVILLSDCLFFKNYHQELETTLYELLPEDHSGFCLLANPARGDSARKFFELAEKRFEIEEINKDEFLTKQLEEMKLKKSYNEDTDDIKIYKMQKRKSEQ